MVPNPDPKQYWNNWKNDIIVFCDQLGETLWAAPTQLYMGGEDGTPKYLHVLQPPTLRFPFWRNGLYLLYLKFSALIRDDKHFARVQGSAINKPIIHIFSSAGRELATVKVCGFF